MADNPFEIPQSMRDAAEQNLKQAHAAYEQLTDFMTKAMGAWMDAMPASGMVAGFKDVQDRALAMANQNADSAFDVLDKMTKVQNFQEILTLQTQFAQDRMQAFTTQTQAALQADRGGFPEAATRLIFPRRQTIFMACQLQTIC